MVSIWETLKNDPYAVQGEGPGPIPSVLERFDEANWVDEKDRPDDLDWYTVVQVTPEHANALRYYRSDVGLVLYQGCGYAGHWESLCDIKSHLKSEIGVDVIFREYHSDLTYWTVEEAPAKKPAPVAD